VQVLVIEDNEETAAYLRRGLTEAGWGVDHHDAPQSALLAVGAKTYDAIILDRMLPGMDGIDALRLMRGAGITAPVIVLTARSGIEDRVEGLDAGADDYLVKPFAMTELLARLRSLVRRKPEIVAEDTVLKLGDLTLDRVARRAERAGDTLDLSPLEFKLLECLLQHPGEVVTRTMLLERVWGYRFDPKTSLVQTHMSRLRTKVDKPYDRDLISTVRGAGYVIADA